MKKIITAVATAALCTACAISMAACSSSTNVKIIEISLSNEQYGVAIAKDNDSLKTQVNEVITALTGDGVTVGDKTVTFSTLYDAEKEAETSNNHIRHAFKL